MSKTAAEWWADAQQALTTGDGNAILDCTKEVLTLEPDHTEARELRATVYLQAAVPQLEAAGEWERMLEIGAEVEELIPESPFGAMVQAGALLELARYEDCERVATKLAEAQPDMDHAYYLRATSLLRRDRFEEAIPFFDQTLAREPTHGDAMINKGMCLDELGRYDEALAVYDAALTHEPGQVFLHGNRGNTLRNLGRHDEAIASYEKALALKPGDFHNGRLRAEALVDAGRPSDAITAALELAGLSREEYVAACAAGHLLQEGDEQSSAMALCILLRSGPDTVTRLISEG